MISFGFFLLIHVKILKAYIRVHFICYNFNAKSWKFCHINPIR